MKWERTDVVASGNSDLYVHQNSVVTMPWIMPGTENHGITYFGNFKDRLSVFSEWRITFFSFFLQGLYPDFNGIVDNSMYDMALNMSFSLGSESSFNKSWWGGEPVMKNNYYL